jgi:hypothetical protein
LVFSVGTAERRHLVLSPPRRPRRLAAARSALNASSEVRVGRQRRGIEDTLSPIQQVAARLQLMALLDVRGVARSLL